MQNITSRSCSPCTRSAASCSLATTSSSPAFQASGENSRATSSCITAGAERSMVNKQMHRSRCGWVEELIALACISATVDVEGLRVTFGHLEHIHTCWDAWAPQRGMCSLIEPEVYLALLLQTVLIVILLGFPKACHQIPIPHLLGCIHAPKGHAHLSKQRR